MLPVESVFKRSPLKTVEPTVATAAPTRARSEKTTVPSEAEGVAQSGEVKSVREVRIASELRVIAEQLPKRRRAINASKRATQSILSPRLGVNQYTPFVERIHALAGGGVGAV
jgi:hypothetical protein